MERAIAYFGVGRFPGLVMLLVSLVCHLLLLRAIADFALARWQPIRGLHISLLEVAETKLRLFG